jgi:hypothetical protein
MDDQATVPNREQGRAKEEGPMGSETVNVDVIPKIRQGNSVYCEITAGTQTGANRVKGGIIKLPAGGPYTVNFDLQAGDVPNLSWSTDASGGCNAFWSAAGGCPSANGQDPQVTQSPASNGSTVTLTITPDPSLGKNVVHYALNFDQQGTPGQFDPIIVVG